jgi:eukaryotic-like serine/threonine-protein kinase
MIPSTRQLTFKHSLPGKYLLWLLVGSILLSTFGCTKTGGERLSAQTDKTPRPASTPASTAPSFTPDPTSESTQVIEFHPAGVPTQELSGSCWSVSDVLNRDDAWRCTAGDIIYDPCFSIPGDSQAVVCYSTPLDESTGFKLDLTDPLPARGTPLSFKSAWVVELADGTKCVFMTGATTVFEGERVNYSCSDGGYILGELQEGQVWTARKIRPSSDFSSIEESVQVFIKIVWL